MLVLRGVYIYFFCSPVIRVFHASVFFVVCDFRGRGLDYYLFYFYFILLPTSYDIFFLRLASWFFPILVSESISRVDWVGLNGVIWIK